MKKTWQWTIFSALAVIMLLVLTAPVFSAQGRGITVKLKASEAPGAADTGQVRLYGSSYALVIGIDEYSSGWPRLSNAVKDAELVAEELRKKGFEVTFKKNLSSDDMEKAFKTFFVLNGAKPEARLFVWFAGHGHTLDGEGFLIPIDAPGPENEAVFKFKALSMRRFGELVRLAAAKHAFVVFDSCFSGTIFTTQRARPPAAVTRVTTLPVRQFLASGDANQTVSDDGAFRDLFLRALRGEEKGDANGDGYLTASELGMFLTDRLTNLTQASQTPRYGKLRDRHWDRGDFVFMLPRTDVSDDVGHAHEPDTDTFPRANMEAIFWQSIASSGHAASFEAYLAQYPNGVFASLARVKLDALKKKIASQAKSGSSQGPEKQYVVKTSASSIKKIKRDRHFICYEDGIVYDKNTELEWVAGPDRDTTWNDANSWAESLSLAGGGWRMPTLKELKGLYEKGKGSRNMTPLLKATGWWVWSGEIRDSSSAWYLTFFYGRKGWDDRNDSFNERGFAVRSRR